MTADEWADALKTRIREFSLKRGQPVVEVYLLYSGVALRAKSVTAGPGDSLLTFDVYPDVDPGPKVLAAMVKDADGDLQAPRQVIVAVDRIDRVELLSDAQDAKTIGFSGTAARQDG